MTATMNGARKYVVSNTLSEATWENSSVINGDVYASLAALKKDTGLSTTGSATLVRWLLEQGLVDELHLLPVPPAAGGRRRPALPDGGAWSCPEAVRQRSIVDQQRRGTRDHTAARGRVCGPTRWREL